MPYWGSGPEECDFAFNSVGATIYLILEKLKEQSASVIESAFPEQSMVALLVCLRVLGERFPQNLGVWFTEDTFHQVKSSFETWYSRVAKKLHPEFRNAILAEANKEFALFEKRILKKRKKGN